MTDALTVERRSNGTFNEIVEIITKANRDAADQDPYLTALERHLRQKGHLKVSPNCDLALYKWANRQRLLWQRGRLDLEVERELHAMGFPFEVEDCEWEHAFAQVANCRRRWGRLPAPSSPSGRWLQYQRELWQTGTLPRNREDRLAAEGAFDGQDKGPIDLPSRGPRLSRQRGNDGERAKDSAGQGGNHLEP